MGDLSYLNDGTSSNKLVEIDKKRSTPTEDAGGTAVSKINAKIGSEVTDTDFKLDLSDERLLNGIILAEVLGKPKYFRKGRW